LTTRLEASIRPSPKLASADGLETVLNRLLKSARPTTKKTLLLIK
jgi:hypothetical protein